MGCNLPIAAVLTGMVVSLGAALPASAVAASREVINVDHGRGARMVLIAGDDAGSVSTLHTGLRPVLTFTDASGALVHVWADHPVDRAEAQHTLAQARRDGARARVEGERAQEEGRRAAEQGRRAGELAAGAGRQAAAEGRSAAGQGRVAAARAREDGARAEAEGRREAERGRREAERARLEAERDGGQRF